MNLFCFFFFSSRRRHTRWTGDWSSDVCSSDLSIWPSMANWTLTNSAIRRALDRFVGIDARRKLPLFAAETFESWFAKRNKSEFGNPTSQSSNGKVVFFHDTFVNYNYP